MERDPIPETPAAAAENAAPAHPRTVGRRSQFWPTALQRRLLTVALDEPTRAAAAWHELQPDLDFERMEAGTFELLPLISRQLQAAGQDDPLSGKLNGIYRKSWFIHSLVLERTTAAAETLAAGGIEALFLHGPSLGVRYYAEAAMRYSPYAGLLVRDDALDRAVARLARVGLHERPDRCPRAAGLRRLFDERGNSIVLRTRLAADFGDDAESANDVLFGNAETFGIGGGSLRVPKPTDALLVIAAAGARKSAVADLVWILDAVMISRGGNVEWDALVERAVSMHQTARLRAVLDYIADLPGTGVPTDVRSRLADLHVTRRERLAFRWASGRSPLLGQLPTIGADYLALTRDRSLLGTVAGVPGHLRDHWGLAHVWELPVAVARRTAERLTGRGRESQPSR